jgi:Ca2+/Na+ antiporter
MPAGVFADPLLRWGPLVLLGGLVALFTCSRILAAILPRADDAIGARAVAYFIPIAAASLISILLGRPEIALGIVFGTSVGAMTTVVGFIALAGHLDYGPARWRRVWPFLLAAALLVFVAGFNGTFSWHHALALFLEGLILLSLWHDSSTTSNPTGDTTTTTVLDQAWHGEHPAQAPHTIPLNYATPPPAESRKRPREGAGILLAELSLIAILLWLGSWAVTFGAIQSSQRLRGMSTSGIAGSVISLALVLPMMYGTWRRSAGQRGWAPLTTQIGVVLLNLCLLLPILILLPYIAAYVPQISHWAGDAIAPRGGKVAPLLFPAPMWRIDNVVLIIMGVFLLPVAIGKWTLGREEGMVLIAGYFFYLTVTMANAFAPISGR